MPLTSLLCPLPFSRSRCRVNALSPWVCMCFTVYSVSWDASWAQIWIAGVSWFLFYCSLGVDEPELRFELPASLDSSFHLFLQKEVATTLWWARRCDSGTRRERKRGCQKSSKAIGQWVWSFQKINNGSVRWETLGVIKPYRHREVSIVWGDVSMVCSWLITRPTNYLECCYILPKKFNGPSLFYILNLTIAYSVAGLEKIVS